MSKVSVNVTQLDHGKGLPLPHYATEHAAGVDLPAAVDETLMLEPGAHAMVPTGLSIALPAGYEAQVRPRSGLASIKVILINHGQAPFAVERGMRIAQMVVAPVTSVSWKAVESLDETARGDGGFGSTGTKS